MTEKDFEDFDQRLLGCISSTYIRDILFNFDKSKEKLQNLL